MQQFQIESCQPIKRLKDKKRALQTGIWQKCKDKARSRLSQLFFYHVYGTELYKMFRSVGTIFREYIRGGAGKSLARPGRKQATVTKLGMYSTYSPYQQVFSIAKQDDIHLNYMPLPKEVPTICCVEKILHSFIIN